MPKITRTRVNAAPAEDNEQSEQEAYESYTGNEDMPGDVEASVPSRSFKRRDAVSDGWGAPAEERKEVVKSKNLVLKDRGKIIVKILDEKPAAKYKRHYINSKKRYYTCTQNQCPLCAAGVRASLTFMMNVVDLSTSENELEVLTWTFGNEVATSLQSLMEDNSGEYWPLNAEERYFQVYHEKIANREAPATRVQGIRAKYLVEDYGLMPLNEDEITEFESQRYGKETVYESTNSYLETIADELLPSDLPQKRKTSW